MSRQYTLTVQPGFPDFEELITHYVKRNNFGRHMTIYTFDNETCANFSKEKLEKRGYIVSIQDNDGSSTISKHDTYHNGIKVSSS